MIDTAVNIRDWQGHSLARTFLYIYHNNVTTEITVQKIIVSCEHGTSNSVGSAQVLGL